MFNRIFSTLVAAFLLAQPAAAASLPPPAIGPTESLGTTLRRLADSALQGGNPVDRPPIYGAIQYPTSFKGTSAPADTTALARGDTYNFNSHWYTVGAAGTTGTGTRPTTCSYNADVADGTVRWVCRDQLWLVGGQWAGVALPDGSHNVFKIRQAGVPQTTTSVSISGIVCATATGVATVTTASHGMLGQGAVTIAGETPSTYNGTWNVTVASATTYTINNLACTANDTVHGTSVNAGPGADCAGPVNDGTVILQCMGRLPAPVVSLPTSHTSGLSNWYAAAPSSGQTINTMLPLPSALNSAFRFEGGVPAVTLFNVDPGISILENETTLTSATSCWPAGAPNGMEPYCNYAGYGFNVETRGQVELKFNSPSPVWIIVDGQYLTPDPIIQAYNGAFQYVLLDFTGVAPTGIRTNHNIKIETSGNERFFGVSVAPNDTINPIQVPTDFGVASFGTSLTAGTSASDAPAAWNNLLRYLMGWPDLLNYGAGGSGYLAPGSTTNFAGHALIDLNRYVTNTGKPVKLILIEGGQNDSGATYTNSAIATAASSLVSSIQAAYPNALIVGMDSPYGKTNSAPVAGACVISGSPATSVALTAANGGAFVVTGGSSGAGNLVGTRYINIGGHPFTVASATSTTALTVTSATSNDGLLTLNPGASTIATGTSWASNVITFTTSAAHNYSQYEYVVVAGVTPSGYNGTYQITTVPSSTTFTVTQNSNPGAWVSGGTATGSMGCYSSNAGANLATTEEAIQAAYAAFNNPYIQYVQTVGGPLNSSGAEMTGLSNNQATSDGQCYLGSAAGTGNSAFDLSNNGAHPNNCGELKIARTRAAALRQLFFSKNASGAFVIP